MDIRIDVTVFVSRVVVHVSVRIPGLERGSRVNYGPCLQLSHGQISARVA